MVVGNLRKKVFLKRQRKHLRKFKDKILYTVFCAQAQVCQVVRAKKEEMNETRGESSKNALTGNFNCVGILLGVRWTSDIRLLKSLEIFTAGLSESARDRYKPRILFAF